jgi:hypothetical protein
VQRLCRSAGATPTADVVGWLLDGVVGVSAHELRRRLGGDEEKSEEREEMPGHGFKA